MDWSVVGQNCIKGALSALHGVKVTKAFDNSVNPHTDADLISHNAIVAALKKSKVSCNVISEEFSQVIAINGGGMANVIIDPIDGTAFFIREEFPFCAVGMFVVESGEPSYSFVGDISNSSIYYCDRGQAYKDGEPVKITQNHFGKSVLAGWAPYNPRMKRFYEKFSKLPDKEYLMFNFGQMANTVKIIGGHYDACFEILPAKLQEFAGAIIVWRAGGELSTMEGNPIVWDPNIKQTMLVSRDKEIHQKLLTAFNS